MKNVKAFLPVIIFLIVIIAAGIIIFFVSDKKSSTMASENTFSQVQSEQSEETNTSIDNIDQKWSRGNPEAKIQIIEFSDFQCPYCQKGADVIAQTYEKYKDQINITFSHFPLTSIHPYALPAARASEAAGYQGKFWEMHDLLFANQKNLANSDLESYAKKLGLDMAKFQNYFNNKNIKDKIDRQLKETVGIEYDELALDNGKKVVARRRTEIEGTPAFLINGKLIAGAYPFEEFEIFIKYFLNQK